MVKYKMFNIELLFIREPDVLTLIIAYSLAVATDVGGQLVPGTVMSPAQGSVQRSARAQQLGLRAGLLHLILPHPVRPVTAGPVPQPT